MDRYGCTLYRRVNLPSTNDLIKFIRADFFNSNFRRNTDDIQIKVGSNNWKTGGTYYKPEKLIPHEDFGSLLFAYDIGLIRLQTPIEFSENVQPIKLSTKEVGADENVQVTGWGRLSVSSFSIVHQK